MIFLIDRYPKDICTNYLGRRIRKLLLNLPPAITNNCCYHTAISTVVRCYNTTPVTKSLYKYETTYQTYPFFVHVGNKPYCTRTVSKCTVSIRN
jgi:hypothetical protein